MGGMKALLGDTPYASRYPQTPGFKEETTSREAGESMADRAKTLRGAVLASIKEMPGTADEIAARLRESVLSIRPRLSELRTQSQIMPSGARRKNESGKSAIVWRATT